MADESAMTSRGDVQANVQAVANLLTRADALAKHDDHNGASRRITKQIQETLAEVISALQNGDVTLAGDLMDGLQPLQAELFELGGNIALTTSLSELVADCNVVAKGIGDD